MIRVARRVKAEPMVRSDSRGVDINSTVATVLFRKLHMVLSTPLNANSSLHGQALVAAAIAGTDCAPSVALSKYTKAFAPLVEKVALSRIGGGGGAEVLRIVTSMMPLIALNIVALGPEIAKAKPYVPGGPPLRMKDPEVVLS